ncbi:aminoacrylate peracid reductase [Anaerolineales bacterium]|nr:aminoacrylate peracid reductase [Anaerolineales bacterium]
MKREVVHTDKAPKAIGPYSQAIRTNSMIFAAGQTGIDPATGEVVSGGVEAQARQVLTNLQNVIEAAGSSFKHVVKTTVFLRDMNDFAKMNAIYAEYFGENPPARSTIAVAGLPKNGLVEIEAIAVIP